MGYRGSFILGKDATLKLRDIAYCLGPTSDFDAQEFDRNNNSNSGKTNKNAPLMLLSAVQLLIKWPSNVPTPFLFPHSWVTSIFPWLPFMSRREGWEGTLDFFSYCSLVIQLLVTDNNHVAFLYIFFMV